jgi:hypothetical protein
VFEKHSAQFSMFCHVIYRAIGTLPETLTDRSIVIDMKRKKKWEAVEYFIKVKPELEELRKQESWWARQHTEIPKASYPDLPHELDNRAEDAWRSLLAVADEIGGEWPDRARAAAIKISLNREQDDESMRTQLLRDFYERLFRPKGEAPIPKLTSLHICGN